MESYTLAASRINQFNRIGFLISHDGPSEYLKLVLGDIHETQFSFFPICSGEQCEKDTFIQFYWLSRYELKTQWYWHWKALFENLDSKSNFLSAKQTQTQLFIGLSYNF